MVLDEFVQVAKISQVVARQKNDGTEIDPEADKCEDTRAPNANKLNLANLDARMRPALKIPLLNTQTNNINNAIGNDLLNSINMNMHLSGLNANEINDVIYNILTYATYE